MGKGEPDVSARDRRAGFGQRLSIGRRPALLIVDFVQAYLDPDSPLYAGVENEREVAATLLAACRERKLPIFHTCVRYTPGGADGGLFYRKLPLLKVFDAGSPLGAFAEGLAPASDEVVVVKQYASAFFGTSLAATLTAAGIDTTIIAGLSTSGCVRATAVDALQHGFAPIVVRDAVGDREPGPHEANLFDLQAKYAQVLDAKAVLAELDARAGNP